MSSSTEVQKANSFTREKGFAALYANNVRLESSVWDLKLVFGLLDQSHVPNTVDQHTSISLPWIQAKLLSYFLEANIRAHELDNGPIAVPMSVPPPAPEITQDVRDEPTKALFLYLADRHESYFGAPRPHVSAPDPEPQSLQ